MIIPTAVCKSVRLTAGAFCLAVLMTGCASLVPQTMALRNAWPQDVATRVDLDEVPFFPQQDYQCGPAALATAMVNAGAMVTPADLVSQVYLPARQGSLQVEMLAAPRTHNLVSYQLAPHFDDLLREVAAGNPVIVLQDTGYGPITNWHYAVVTGYNYAAGELYLRSGDTRRQRVPFTVFEYTWKKSNYWAMIVLPAGRIPATASETTYLPTLVAMARVGDAPSVITAYTGFLDRWPGNAGASIALANQYHVLNELKKAESVLRQAAASHPDSVVVLNNLAQTLSDQGRHAEAMVFINQAVKLEGPFASAVLETRALILQRQSEKK
jgi:hypothetical protein